MRLLLLGGPKFLGRAVLDAALARGHDVTTFNRGNADPALYPEVERLVGDRDGGLEALRGRAWEAVIDTSGYVPRVVSDSARLLADAAGHYVFVSSISVYASFGARIDESSPTAALEEPGSEDVAAHYGALKALCEQEVEAAFPGRALHARAGLIVGPHDPTDRFTYWPVRIARGGEVLVPGGPERQVQFVDVRDLADWLVGGAERGTAGVFNATGPSEPLAMRSLFETCRAVSGSDADPVWVEEAFLVQREVGQWLELPLWVDTADPESAHLMDVDASRALAAGLSFRALDETVSDTLAWAATRSDPGQGTQVMGPASSVGLAPERERELLDAWRSR